MAPHATGDEYFHDNSSNIRTSPSQDIDPSQDVVEAIAVVGMAVGFPQDIQSPEALWKTMMEKRSTVTGIPDSRMASSSLYHPDPDRHGQISVKKGHFLDRDLAMFDAPFFATSTSDAAGMDPQQRLLLEYSYLALENAGISMEQAAGSRTSVFTGTFCMDWCGLMFRDGEECSTTASLGAAPNLNANRISWFFDLHGSSVNVDTACSSSLVCLHLACQGLRSGSENMSIVTGSNIMLSPDTMHSLTNLNMLSPDGECFSFDHRGNGYSRGEGVGVLVLKRVSDAIRDGDTIRGIIRSTACNQDGKTSSVTVPDTAAQADLIRQCYSQADLSMEPTRFVEAHGTGTSVGDPTEANALGSVFRKVRRLDDPLWVGAVKANIGHLEGASGIAGVVKTILALEKAVIPPNTNFEKLNSRIDADFLRLKFPVEATPWPTQGLRRASVNSFGNGGTNAHVVLDDVLHFLEQRGLSANHVTIRYAPVTLQIGNVYEAPRSHLAVPPSDTEQLEPRLIVLSAADKAGIARQAEKHVAHFSSKLGSSELQQKFVDDFAYTLAHRRNQMAWRSFAVVQSLQDLHRLDRLVSKAKSVITSPGICYVFTGQGAQWAGMGRELLKFPVFRQTMINLEEYLLKIGCSWTIRTEILREKNSRIDLPEFSQPLCTAIQIALVRLLEAYGIAPRAVVGHSSGEIAAAYCAGALSETSAMKVAYHRGRLAGQLAEAQDLKGAMMSVALSETDVLPYLDRAAAMGSGLRALAIACINSPSNITISGEASQLDILEQLLEVDKIFHRKLAVNVAYHSDHMQPIADAYRNAIEPLEQVSKPDKRAMMFSTVTGEQIHNERLACADYWVRNMISPVRFTSAISALVTRRSRRVAKKLDLSHRSLVSVDLMIEIGPHSALQRPIKDTLMSMPMTAGIDYTSCLVRRTNAAVQFLSVIGQVHCSGHSVRLTSVKPSPGASRPMTLPDLPGYSFDHSKRYWHESRISSQYRTNPQPRLDLLGKPVADWNAHEPRWRNHLRVSEMPWIEHHVINGSTIYPGAGMIVMAIEAMYQIADNSRSIDGVEIQDVSFVSPLSIESSPRGVETQISLRLAESADSKHANAWYRFRIFSFEHDTWQERCYGLVRPRYQAIQNTVVDNAEQQRQVQACLDQMTALQDTCKTPMEPEVLYDAYNRSGFGLGPPFRQLRRANFDTSAGVLAEVGLYKWPDNEFPQDHIIHPISLDNVFHVAVALFAEGGHRDIGVMIPKRLGHLFVHCGGLTSKDQVYMHECAWIADQTARTTTYSGFAMDPDKSSVLLEFDQLETTKVAEAQSENDADIWQPNQTVFQIHHLPDVDRLSPEQIMTQHDGPSKPSLHSWIDLLCHKNAGLRLLEVNVDDQVVGKGLLRHLSSVEKGREVVHARYGEYCYVSDCHDGLQKVQNFLKEFINIRYEHVDNLLTGNASDQSGQFDVVLAPSMLLSREDVTLNISQTMKMGGRLVVMGPIEGDDTDSHASSIRQALSDYGFLDAGLSFAYEGRETVVYQLAAKEKAAMMPIEIVYDAVSARQQQFCERFSEIARSENVQVTTASLAEAAQSLETGRVYIVILELDGPFLYSLNRDDYIRWNQLLSTATDVIWINYQGGSTVTRPEYAMIQGVFRVMQREREDLRTTIIALEEDVLSSVHRLRQLLAVAEDHTNDSLIARETEYIEINGVFCIPRICPAREVEDDLYARSLSQISKIQSVNDAPPLRLCTGSTGLIDGLHLTTDQTVRDALAEDEIAIKVRAIGLNYNDCSVAQGLSSGQPLGMECAGVVTHAGCMSNFSPDDRVILLAGDTFKTYARGRASQCVKIPRDMPFTTAAAIAVQFGTAWEIINHIARLQQVESVLVLAAADGIGQATMQLAKLIGAEIFATVRSATEKTILVDEYGIPAERILFHDEPSFSRGIARMTNDRGVDVVVSSLAGEPMRASWKCLAPYGRFIYIGQQDSLTNTALPLADRGKNFMFATFDQYHFQKDKPLTVMENVRSVLDKFVNGTLRLPTPLRVYDVSDFKQGFQALSAGRMAGKIVFEVNDTSEVAFTMNNDSTTRLDPQASYIIAGGLGGLGRSISRWMVGRGAQNLILLSRRGPRTEEAFEFIAELQVQDVRVETPACDVSDLSRLQEVLRSLSKQLPPIRGCIQASVVARDRLFQGMDFTDWDESVKCKTVGSWNLHSALPSGMDFFLTLASGSGLVGIRGQTNYNAGNCYQDALARFRVAGGERAASFDLGAMEDDGILAEDPELLQRVLTYGLLRAVSRRAFHALLDRYCDAALPLLAPDDSQVAVGLGFGASDMLESASHARHPMMSPLQALGEQLQQRQGDAAGTANAVANPRTGFAASASVDEGAAVVAEAVAGKLQQSLAAMMNGDAVDVDKPLVVYGVDSLLAVELRNWVAKQFEADVAIFEVQGMSTLATLGFAVARKSAVKHPKWSLEIRE